MSIPDEQVRSIARDFLRHSLRRSVTVALFVGTLLNLINQGDSYWSGSGFIWWKVLLTYFVPFAVARYGSYFALRASAETSPRESQ